VSPVRLYRQGGLSIGYFRGYRAMNDADARSMGDSRGMRRRSQHIGSGLGLVQGGRRQLHQ